jgi:hypothetical protein
MKIHSTYYHIYYDTREGKQGFKYNKGAFINGHHWAINVSYPILNAKVPESICKDLAEYFTEIPALEDAMTYLKSLNKYIIVNNIIN